MSTAITDAEIAGLLEAAGRAGDEATVILAHIALGDEDVEQRIEVMGGWYDLTRDQLRAMSPEQARAALADVIAQAAAAGD
jgi:hypothetical protein